MDIFLINVDSATERLAFQNEQLSTLGLPFKRISAITTDDIDTEIYEKHYFDWQRPLRKTEVACYFSHRLAWETVKKNNRPALILEDDAVLSKATAQTLAALEKYESIDLVTLEVRGRKKFVGKNKEPLTEANHLLKLYKDKTGAAAYILWPSGVNKLLMHEIKKGIALADAQLFSCKNLRTYQVEPACAVQLDQCEFYGIEKKNSKNLAQSTVSSKIKVKKEKIFYFKRFLSQLQLGIKKFFILFKTSRRYIYLNNQSF